MRQCPVFARDIADSPTILAASPQVPEINSIKIPNKISFESGGNYFFTQDIKFCQSAAPPQITHPRPEYCFWSLFGNQDRYICDLIISHDNLHITQNLTVCQLLLCDPPNCQNSLTKLKFLMLYSIVDIQTQGSLVNPF